MCIENWQVLRYGVFLRLFCWRARSIRLLVFITQIVKMYNMNIPDKDQKFPLANYERLCFLKNIVRNPNIIVGDYTYYDDFENVENFVKNVRYHFDFIDDKLFIGKFFV